MPKKQKATRIKLIANPGSGKMEGNALLEQVIRCLQDQGFKVDVALAHPNEKAIPIASRAIEDGYRTVVAMGGDDTVWAVMRALAGSKVRLGIIPSGTENNQALALGIPPATGPESVEGACAVIASGKTRKIDLGEVWRKKGKKLVFCEVVAVGIAADLYPHMKKIPKGDLSRIKDAVSTVIRKPSNPKMLLTLDKESQVEVKSMLVAVMNLPVMGAHFVVAPDASLEDGLLDVVTYPEFSKPQLLAHFAQLNDQGTADDSKVQRYRARKIRIKASPKQAVLADGVLFGKGAVKIRVRPGALRVIAPEVGTGVEAPPRKEVVATPAPAAPSATRSDGNEAVTPAT